ncbi:MAG: hypothetical protein AVDCRST_MAG88-1071 [uncultured Thermomicrobiales bacterium]|uniref:Uncharacterized protein n=1 Tax=uncultured Thermomicrobiales bacterium TaxID=1645740 RepID=A0A6J4UMT7_9BACT|nr:MAG: hypothetical protein AVDCRST_MAG88-1071 [uncultured Thermomicrobiales bacterium]
MLVALGLLTLANPGLVAPAMG